MSTPRDNLLARLGEITPGCTTLVRVVVVTRCSNGTFELETWGSGPFLAAEQAVDQLLQRDEGEAR